MLAFESPMLLSLAALLSSWIWLLVWSRFRTGYMLLLAGSWLLLCVYWGLLAISAGPAPVLLRADIAISVRVLGLAAAILLVSGKALMMWQWWHASRREYAARPT